MFTSFVFPTSSLISILHQAAEISNHWWKYCICTNIEVYFISDIYCNPMMKSLVYFYSLNVCFILWKLYASGTNAAYIFESLNKILNSIAISNFGWIFHVRVSLFFSKSLVVSLAHTIIHSNIDSTEQTKYCSIWQRFPVKRQFQ